MNSQTIKMAGNTFMLHRVRSRGDDVSHCKSKGKIEHLTPVDCRYVYYAPDSVFCGKCFADLDTGGKIAQARMVVLQELTSYSVAVEWANELTNQLLMAATNNDPRR